MSCVEAPVDAVPGGLVSNWSASMCASVDSVIAGVAWAGIGPRLSRRCGCTGRVSGYVLFGCLLTVIAVRLAPETFKRDLHAVEAPPNPVRELM
jgi:hypothetical protein